MHVLVSLLNLRIGKIGGTETYLRELVARLPALAPDDRWTLLLTRDVAQQLDTTGWRTVVWDVGPRRVIAERCAEAFTPYRCRTVERLIEAVSPDVALFPQQSLFPKSIACPVLLTALDVQHLFYPHYFSWFDRAFRQAAYPPSFARADGILAISAFTRQTLIERCHVPAEKVEVVLLGTASPGSVSQSIRDTVGDFLYYPAASLPHKNHLTLFKTLATLRRSGTLPYRLVLSGIQTPYWNVLKQKIRALGMSDFVEHRGYVTADEVARLYDQCRAVVFPTQFEGFGLPIVEAVAHGKLVIASDLAVFRELGLPQECRIDFAQPDQLMQALQQTGPTRLERPLPTWDDCIRQTREALARLVRRTPRSTAS